MGPCLSPRERQPCPAAHSNALERLTKRGVREMWWGQGRGDEGGFRRGTGA